MMIQKKVNETVSGANTENTGSRRYERGMIEIWIENESKSSRNNLE